MYIENLISEYIKVVGVEKEEILHKQIIDRICKEKEKKSKLSVKQIITMIKNGRVKEASSIIVLLENPHRFCDQLNLIRENVYTLFLKSDPGLQMNIMLFLLYVTLNLKSFLPYWNLLNDVLYPGQTLTEIELDRQIKKNRKLLVQLENDNLGIVKEVLFFLNKTTEERLISEDVKFIRKDDIKRIDSIFLYLEQMSEFIEKSNLLKISQMRNKNSTLTEIGNDYAAHLLEAMWLGASFVTTNPQLAFINYERKLDLSNSQIDNLVKEFLRSRGIEKIDDFSKEMLEELGNIFTAEVVINNASLLRDIFLLTEGRKGYVCLQVNPIYHGDADKMLKQALRIFKYLYKRMDGVPNVVFKLPGTKEGLEVQKILTNIGIGANITVEFGLFQIIPFAKAIDFNNTIVSHLTLMNGRLAFPVRDELVGLGVPNGKKASQWAGVAVGKKAYDILYNKEQLGFDPSKVKLLIASLRNYDNFFPDITELTGAPIITVFPNIRNEFDNAAINIEPQTIKRPVDENIIKILSKSEIFKQAYYLPGDPEYLKPKSILSLEKSEEVKNWMPVKATLDVFIEAREKTEEVLQERVNRLIS